MTTTELDCPATGRCMRNNDEALSSIISTGRGLLVKMLIHVTLGPHDIFCSDVSYLYILTLFGMQNVFELNRLTLNGMYILAEALQNFTSVHAACILKCKLVFL